MHETVIDLGDGLEIAFDPRKPTLVEIRIYQDSCPNDYYSGTTYLSDLRDAIAVFEDRVPTYSPEDLIV
jgi:hypothetical protein